MKRIHPRLKLYAVTLLAVGSAFILTFLLKSLLTSTIFLLFFAAVAVSAWYGGMEAGLLAIALSSLLVSYFFLEPVFSFFIYSLDSKCRLGLFVMVATLISWLNSALRTAKQRLEESMQQLQASEAKFRCLVESDIIGTIVADMSGAIAEANDAFLKMVGYTRQDLLAGRVRWCDMTPPEYQEADNRSITQLRTTGVCQPFEKEYIRKDGSRVPVLLGSALLDNNQQIIGFVLDLTARKQAENALRESQSRYRALTNATIESVVIHENGKILDANPAFARMFGYEISEVIGMPVANFLTPESYKICQETVQSGDEKYYEVTALKKDGTNFFLEVVVKSYTYQGRQVRVSAGRNITERKQAEAALRESEKRFRRLVESNIFGVAFSNFNGSFHYANDYFLNMVGYTREEMLAGQMRWDAMTPPEYLDLNKKGIEELLKYGVATPFEKEYIKKDGSRVPILIGVALLQEPYDRHQEIITFCLDLTQQQAARQERQRAEQALRQREEELRLITNAVPVFISYVDTQQRYRFNNKKYEEWYGISASETYGKHIQEVVDETVYQSIRPYIERVLSGEQVTYETQLPDKDGTIHYVIITYVPQFNQEGTVEGFVTLISDITERKRSEAALKASEERFRKLTEKVRVIPWEVDATTGNFTYVGPQTVEILGYPLTDWYADNFWEEHIHPEDREWAIEYCIESSLTLDNYEFEYRMLAADGRVVWLYDIVNVVRNGRTPRQLHGFMIDITDRKFSEQEREQLLKREQAARASAEAANRMKDEFLGTLSHELRTPLNAMQGWTQLLRSRKFNETTTAQALETIDRNTRSLAQLIEDVLDVSRIIRGTLHLKTHPLELIAIVEAAIDTIRPAADAKEIRIECRFDPAVGVVMGDANRLQQIVWNLLSNAVKFTSKEGIVTVQLERINSGVQIRVSDTGGGIAPEFLPYVFERFRQADSSTTRSHGGLGLGLAIVRHLVELHGGTVCAESPGIGQGATFIVNLPMKAIAVDVSKPEQLSPLNSSEHSHSLPTLNGLRVLVVDDEPDTRQLVTTVLGQYGAQVMAVTSAFEAIDALQQFHPDILVSDIGMPQEDGYALIRKLRALSQEQGGKIPAVALTAYARAEDRTQALLAGFQLHVPKPVNPTELAAVVANLAGRT
ncbi:PAS domain S-box protein [Nostocaceae cyanobacterium CENA369]|uniref:Circadian input-output histidine kinase CikA n=1 Tax=Dendronalium phyllosphericum CENA369 TaxID=1725256 RepID=A0A8J7LE79_9NOST|nr:PAS domain S-box protein [Dendronalium phyllosphericum]MBH8573881.1 PAS domain S-box protein [Dendronalium phyllosphericum CENA369]